MTTVHGACVMIAGIGVLLRGSSGRGKSDLALRLIDEGATLVADDRVDLARDGDALVASAPAGLAGLLEARGVGLMRLPAVGSARLALVVDLVETVAVERLPDPDSAVLSGVALPRIALAPFEASAPAKLRLAVRAVAEGLLFSAPADPPPAAVPAVIPVAGISTP
jgi:HPr kinase/phosphorylase